MILLFILYNSIHLPYNHSELPNSTWSLDSGYENPSGSVYPFNSLGGTFVLNQFRYDIEPNCDFFQGFKVLSVWYYLLF